MGETTVAKTRIKSLDVFKGIAIFFVVVAHLFILEPMINGSTSSFTKIESIIIEFFYVGLIVFFIVSGYFYKPEEGLSKKVIERVIIFIIILILCMIILPLLLYGYLSLLGYNISVDELLNTIMSGLTGYGRAFQPYDNITTPEPSALSICAGYYFIFVMIESTVLYYLIAKYAMKDIVCTVVSIIALLTLTMFCVEVIQVRLPYFLELAPFATAAMLCGTAFHKYKVVEKMETHPFEPKMIGLAIASLIVGLLIAASIFRSDLGFHTSHFGLFGGFSAYTLLIMALVCGFFHLWLCVLISKIPYFCDLLMLMGRNSLVILMLSTFFCKIIIAPFMTLPSDVMYPYLTLGQIFIIGPISIALCLLSLGAMKWGVKKVGKKFSNSSSRTS